MKLRYLWGPMCPVYDLFVAQSQGAIHDQSAVTSTTSPSPGAPPILAALNDVSAGRDPQGVIRDEAQNECSDLLVMTETLDASEEIDAFCERMTAEKIFIS